MSAKPPLDGPQIGHAALLRAVNVGGRNRVPMAELLAIAAALGLASPRTHLQSGNLVFAALAAEGARIGEALRAAIAERLSVTTPVIVRTADEIAAALANNPFPEAATSDPSHLLVVFLSQEGDAGGLPALRALAAPGERLELVGRELFVHYAHGLAKAKVTAAAIDRRLGAAGTARNWTTCLALERLAKEAALAAGAA